LGVDIPRAPVGRPVATPNVILVVTDKLGYSDIEPFGSTLHRTLHLTRMVQEGRCVRDG